MTPISDRVAATVSGIELQHLSSGYNVSYIKSCITGTDLWMRCTHYQAHLPYRSHFMEIQLSLPCSQEPATGLCPQPDESSEHPHTPCL